MAFWESKVGALLGLLLLVWVVAIGVAGVRVHLATHPQRHAGDGIDFESMLMRVPVLAYSATAVPHTLGGAGVQFTDKSLPEVAELASALLTDQALRESVLAGQEQRLAAFSPETVEGTLRTHVDSL